MDRVVWMPCTVYCIRVSSLYVLLMKYICAFRLICMHSVLKKCYLMYVLSMKCICAFHFSNPLYSVKTLLASHILTQHNTIQYNDFLDSPEEMLCCSVEPFMSFFVWHCDCVQCTVHVNLFLKWLLQGAWYTLDLIKLIVAQLLVLSKHKMKTKLVLPS